MPRPPRTTDTVSRKVPPYFRADYDVPDVSALQALARGEADADQQRRALDWIIRRAAGTYQVSFQPGAPDATAFSEGRRFVGTEIVKLLALSLRDLMAAEERRKTQGK